MMKFMFFPQDPDAKAFITASSITDTTQQSAINNLVVDFKQNGIWAKMKAIYPMVGGTELSHKFNLKDSRDLDDAFRLSFAGGWTHSANGALPNGVNAYANTFLNDSVTMQLNNSHISYYTRTDNGAQNMADMGCFITGNHGTSIYIRTTGDVEAHKSQNSVTTTSYSGKTSGHFIVNRTNSTNFQLIIDGVQFYDRAEASVSTTNLEHYLGCMNVSGTPSNYSNRECAFATLGEGLTGVEYAAMYSAIQSFQTKLNRQV